MTVLTGYTPPSVQNEREQVQARRVAAYAIRAIVVACVAVAVFCSWKTTAYREPMDVAYVALGAGWLSVMLDMLVRYVTMHRPELDQAAEMAKLEQLKDGISQ